MKRILCFGDSLTWGFDPVTRTRFEEDCRWPCVMQEALGSGYKVIEEGQNGRTIATEDPAEGEKNGIVMLGSNDCKRKFAYSSMDIAGEMQIMLEKIQSYNRFRCSDRIKVILVSPPHVAESIKDSWLGDSFGFENAVKLSKELSPWSKQLADMYGCTFADAAEYVKVSDADGIHMDGSAQQKLGKVLADIVTG